MKNESKALLASLLDAPSPSGYEGPARRIWCEALSEVADEVRVDVHGNAIAALNPGGSPRIMLAGHIDELGFQICHIEESGLMRFRPIGGHDLRSVSGRRIHIHTSKGPILAVIGQTPVHLMKDRTRSIPIRAESMWIDAGFDSRRKAEKVVQIGDPATYVDSFAEINSSVAVARGFDNRVGAFIVGETLRALASTKNLKPAVFAVATVQEEIGIRGAKTSAFGLDPDVGIAVDVTWATDNPGGNAKEIGEVKLGKGPVISRGPNINHALFDLLKSTATRSKIPVQYRSIAGASGTDANAMQLTRAGLATALIGIPNRYMHSPVELCHLKDISDAIRLLTATIKRINSATDFIPH